MKLWINRRTHSTQNKIGRVLHLHWWLVKVLQYNSGSSQPGLCRGQHQGVSAEHQIWLQSRFPSHWSCVSVGRWDFVMEQRTKWVCHKFSINSSAARTSPVSKTKLSRWTNSGRTILKPGASRGGGVRYIPYSGWREISQERSTHMPGATKLARVCLAPSHLATWRTSSPFRWARLNLLLLNFKSSIINVSREISTPILTDQVRRIVVDAKEIRGSLHDLNLFLCESG